MNGTTNLAILHSYDQINIASQLHEYALIIESYANLGDIYSRHGDPKTGLKFYSIAKRILVSQKNFDNSMYINYGLSYCNYELKDFSQAERFINQEKNPLMKVLRKET